MGNKSNFKSVDFYRSLIPKLAESKEPKILKLKSKTVADVCLENDVDLIKKYCNSEIRMLDIGSGTGMIINKILDVPQKITCVEYFKEFSDYIIPSKNIKIINEDILQLNLQEKFHLVTAFGTFHHFSNEEIESIYHKIFAIMYPEATLIIKNQFSIVAENIIIDKYSEELEHNYYSCYRTLETEKKILQLAGFSKKLEIIDIYPPKYNRWQNTHFYAFILKK